MSELLSQLMADRWRDLKLRSLSDVEFDALHTEMAPMTEQSSAFRRFRRLVKDQYIARSGQRKRCRKT